MNDPEEGSVVPGVNVSVHVESIHNIKVVTVSSEPHEKEGHGSEDGQNQVDEASSGLPTQSNVPRVVNVESVGEYNVERGSTEHHREDSKNNAGNLIGSFPRFNDTITVKIDTSVASGGRTEVGLEATYSEALHL